MCNICLCGTTYANGMCWEDEDEYDGKCQDFDPTERWEGEKERMREWTKKEREGEKGSLNLRGLRFERGKWMWLRNTDGRRERRYERNYQRRKRKTEERKRVGERIFIHTNNRRQPTMADVVLWIPNSHFMTLGPLFISIFSPLSSSFLFLTFSSLFPSFSLLHHRDCLPLSSYHIISTPCSSFLLFPSSLTPSVCSLSSFPPHSS